MAAKSEYLIEIKVVDGKAQANVQGLTKGFESLDSALKRVKTSTAQASKETDNLGKKNLDLMSKAGLAGATLTEVGRTISDLPYGIRGIANNLSQLSTLFITLVSTTGGLTNAIKLLRKQLAGPLGVVLAFQAVIAAIDYFAGRAEKAEASIDSFGNRFGESAAKLRSYRQILNDSTVSAEEKKRVIKEVARETDGLNVSLGDNNQLTEDSNRLLRTNIARLTEQAEARALLDRLTELNTDKLKLEYQLRQALGSEYDRMLHTLSAAPGGAFLSALGLDNIGGLTNQMNDINKEIADILSKLAEGTLDVFDPDKKKGKRARKLIDDFNIYFTKKQDELSVATSRTEIGRLMELNAQKSNMYLIDRNKRIENEKKLLDEGLITEEQYLQRKADLNALYLDQIAELNKQTSEDILKAQIERLVEGMNIAATLADDLLEAEITREERKTVLMNNQLKKQLRNEKLSAEEREAINNQIAANEESLAQKRDELAEKQFKINKAANIATALLNTYLAATDVLARQKGGIVAKIAAMTLVVATGLAQVAAIARTQFVPSALSAGGAGAGGAGGGAGATIEAPDFNVVGASAQSQLAETVAGAEAKPVRAFVVGKDITTQQELDRNIRTTASFG